MWLNTWCCRTHVCVLPGFICWNPNLQEDGIRKWGFWEVTRSWGWSPHDWLSVLIRRGRDPPYLFLACEDTARTWVFATQKRGLPKLWLYWCCHLRFLTSITVGNELLLLKPFSLWYCVIAAQAKTLGLRLFIVIIYPTLMAGFTPKGGIKRCNFCED